MSKSLSSRPLSSLLSVSLIVAICGGLIINPSTAAWAAQQDADTPRSTPPQDFTSQNFLLHTDLPRDEAQELLQQLETMLGLLAAYWGRPSSGTIEMYVVRDLKNWPEDSLHPRGRDKIESGAGVTISQKITSRNRFIAKAVVFAVAERGVAKHEAVHAYCHQAFGTVGPVWYSEGMAEMGQYFIKDDLSVNAEEQVIRYLQENEPRSVLEIVDDAEENSQTGDSWQSYAWRWALCHLLEVNPNYRQKFRALGLHYLSGQPKANFDTVFGREAEQLNFEYRFFLEHLEEGFRADLCAWDWSKKFRLVAGRRTMTAKVAGNKGWQPSIAQVQAGKSYTITATGNWRLTEDGEMISPAGDAQGAGKLQGVLLTADYELTEPFDIGEECTFTAEADGQLYLRCADGWTELADNAGTVTVKTSLAAEK